MDVYKREGERGNEEKSVREKERASVLYTRAMWVNINYGKMHRAFFFALPGEPLNCNVLYKKKKQRYRYACACIYSALCYQSASFLANYIITNVGTKNVFIPLKCTFYSLISYTQAPHVYL